MPLNSSRIFNSGEYPARRSLLVKSSTQQIDQRQAESVQLHHLHGWRLHRSEQHPSQRRETPLALGGHHARPARHTRLHRSLVRQRRRVLYNSRRLHVTDRFRDETHYLPQLRGRDRTVRPHRLADRLALRD